MMGETKRGMVGKRRLEDTKQQVAHLEQGRVLTEEERAAALAKVYRYAQGSRRDLTLSDELLPEAWSRKATS